ncbi:ATP-binding cassette domain-containing protein [Haloferax sp. MBLA0076]|uniref:Nickel import system ATP-binding protein NikD n=1 Tax=Haloferax litoreum TaxID=2666140 RepID=A0A6A8GNE1_9EURY|nr:MULTISPECIES: ABC transporter ATP-binding protein [Haloferax]KAB1190435.1 ABC transporter ATP-binding protein [Haloferax sp. CBA1148]MRX23410.1 ATP-binding cassette domain-containing protein [Haloferax litoreum]
MGAPLLEVEDLTIQYKTSSGPVTAVSGVTFTVEEAEYFGLVGESGCGKSTIAKSLIGGLDENGSIVGGTIKYRGEEIQDFSDAQLSERIRWKEISLIPQSSMNNLDPLQRVSEQAVEIARTHSDMSKAEALERFGELFETVGLQPSRIHDYPHQFSGGMQQRAVIALALFMEPSLIIADEPTTALDVIMQDQIFKYLDAMKDEFETSMLLITHDISLVFESCQSMAVMHGGQLAETGTVVDLYDTPRHPYSILLQEAFPDIEDPNRELGTIDGTPPRIIGDVNVCTFVDRCPWAIEDCHTAAPPLEQVEGDSRHGVSCFRMDEVHEEYATEKRPDIGTTVEETKADGDA